MVSACLNENFGNLTSRQLELWLFSLWNGIWLQYIHILVFYKGYFYIMPRIWGIEKVLLIIMLRAIPIYLWNISLSLRVTPAIFKIFPRKKVALCKLRSLDYDTCSAKHCWFLQKLFTNIDLKFAEPLYNSFWLTPRVPIITSEITNYHKFQIFYKLFLSHCYCLTSPVLLVPPFCLQLKQNLEADTICQAFCAECHGLFECWGPTITSLFNYLLHF